MTWSRVGVVALLAALLVTLAVSSTTMVVLMLLGWLRGREYPYWHWSNENVRRDGLDDTGEYVRGPRGVPYHGQAWFHLTPAFSISTCWDLWSSACGLSFTRDDEGWDFMAALPPVALYWSVKHRALAARKYGTERQLSLRVFDAALWWNVWTDPHSWTSGTPRWRNGSWHVLDTLLGKVLATERVLEAPAPIAVSMPERVYFGHGELREMTLRRPRWFARRVLRVEIKMADGEQIPIPGKGENSWDCGEDATYGVSMGDVRSVEEAVGRYVGSTLETRRNRGGRGWKPERHVGKYDIKLDIEDGATEKIVEALQRMRAGGPA